MKRTFESNRRYGYGAVDMTTEGEPGVRTILTAIKPAKFADEIAGALQAAYELGRDDALGGASLAVLSIIAAQPSKVSAATIREEVTKILEGSR